MPTDLERELLALAAAEQQRREARTAEQEAEVQPLSRLFAYHMAREAPSPPPAGMQRVAANTPVGEVVVDLPMNDPVAQAIRSGQSMSMSVSHRAPNANGDAFPDISVEDLSSMFMTGEARAQRDLRGLAGYAEFDAIPAEDPFQVEFSSEIEGSTQPNEAVRFQIGRESPPPVTMMNRRAVSTDGRVVSTRGEDGRFRPLQSVGEAIADAYNAREAMADLRQAQSTPLSPRPVTPRRQAPEGTSGLPLASEQCYRPSALERVAGDDWFGEDD